MSHVRTRFRSVALVVSLAIPLASCAGFGRTVEDTTGAGKEVGSGLAAVVAGLGAAALGADAGEAIAIGLAAGAFTWGSYDANELEEERARRQAAEARARLSGEQLDEMERNNVKLAVPVGAGLSDWMIVDAKSGDPVNDTVYEDVRVGSSGARPEPGDVGELGGYTVLFMGEDARVH